MLDFWKRRRAIFLLVATGAVAPVAVGQYTISTIAGGSVPTGVPSTSVSLPYLSSLAVDAGRNVYFVLGQQNRIFRAAADGMITSIAGNGTLGFSGDNGPATNAQINPASVSIDSAGNLYFSDGVNFRIRKISGGVITTIAGNGVQGFSGDGGAATAAQIGVASGIAVDKSGSVFFSDNFRVRKISNGVISTVAGTGTFGFSGDGGLATAAQLSAYGLAVDNTGNLFIADLYNLRIRKVSAGVITTVAGNGSFGFSGDGGPAISAQFTYFSQVIALDGAGNLYIGDGARVRKVSGGVITTVAGTGSATNGQFSTVNGVALDSGGNLYITDNSAYRILKVSAGIISTVAGNGLFQFSGDGGLSIKSQLNPAGIVVQSPGNYFLAEQQNHRIRKSSGGLITTSAGTGSCCYNGENLAATNAFLNASGVAVDSVGNVYTAEADRVRKISGGTIATVAGNGSTGYSGDNGPATSAQLAGAQKVAVDNAGNIYIADRINKRIRRVSGGVITTVAGGGPADGATATNISVATPPAVAVDGSGNAYFPSPSDHRVYKLSTAGLLTIVAGNGTSGFSGDGGPPAAAQLNEPYGVAVNNAGTAVYISDRNTNRVRLVSGGTIVTIAGGGTGCPQQTNSLGDNCPGTGASLNFPAALALNSSGTILYISDSLNYRIRRLTGGVISTVAGNGACCFSGDNGPASAAQLNYAAALAVDNSTGDLYIGDSENFRVRKVSGGTITTVAGTGASGYSGDGGPAVNAKLSLSYGVAVDNTGALYIADAANSRIRKVTGGVIDTVAGTGTAGYSGDSIAASSAQLNVPYAVAVDGTGNLYIADTVNNRIRKVSGGVISTIAGNGVTAFSGDGGQAAQAQLDSPSDVAVDGAGNLYIADLANHRIRQVATSGVITTVAGNGACCYSGDSGLAIDAAIYPVAIAADSSGSIYFADQTNRIRKVSGGIVTTIAGNGQQGNSGDGGLSTAASLNNPQGVAVDTAGNVYIADAGNFSVRLLTVNPKTVTSVSPALAVAGSGNFTIQVTGSGFIAGDTVQWNGAYLTTTFVNSGQLSAFVNSGLIAQLGTAAVTVNGVSNAVAFSILTTLTPSLSVTKTHSATFTAGQLGATYSVTVTNLASSGPTSGTVTVTESIPSGLTLVSMSGTGWTCTAGASTCTRSDVLASGSSYPTVTVVVNVTSNAGGQVTNQVSASGGGSATAMATDPTTIAGLIGYNVGYFQPSGPQWVLDSNGSGAYEGTDKLFTFAGQAGAIAVVGDWSGDGKSKIGYYLNGFWVLDYNGNGVYDSGDKFYGFGGAGASYVPVVGDWNGDGRTKIGFYKGGSWALDTNGNGVFDVGDAFYGYGGNANEVPVVGDWNGDHRTKVGIYFNGTWVLDYDGNGSYTSADKYYNGFTYAAGDKPVVGDWAGDGATKIGVYRGGFWVLDYNGNGTYDGVSVGGDKFYGYGGNAGELPMVADWNGDGKSKIGVYVNGFWVLDYNGNGTYDGVGAGADRFIPYYGGAGSQPIIGRW